MSYWFVKLATLIISATLLAGCGCSKYASAYSCSYVENEADYEVWYWRNLSLDRPEDNRMIGHATGVKQCERNAQAFAAATGQPFDYRAYICVLIRDGERMEKHRNLAQDDR